jgi:cellulose synthase/poly-beta-1,6-N-acetylglucosamine synthase-like glycosyltransferase
VQALYLMLAPEGSRLNHQVAEFAWRVKNWVRPLGLRALNLPCQLVGTGMAFPWKVIRGADLANGAIVEDLKLGLALARAGSPALFCPSALVTSHFPSSASGAKTQRLRWEQGHLAIIATVPSLIVQAIARRNFGLMALALDIAVPPLALLALLSITTCALAGIAVVFGCSAAALVVSATSLAALVLAVLLAWWMHGRDVLPARSLFSLVPFVVGKLPLYRQALSRLNKTQWIRTDRGNSH